VIDRHDNKESKRKEQIAIEKINSDFQAEPFDDIHPTHFIYFVGQKKMNPVDEFRNAFFQKVIDQEKEREREEKLLQSKCFHLYNIIDETFSNTHQQRTCSKCGHSLIKRIEVWEGSKRCIIA
jgi:hypothetical protein